jgi:hypothetical protein
MVGGETIGFAAASLQNAGCLARSAAVYSRPDREAIKYPLEGVMSREN